MAVTEAEILRIVQSSMQFSDSRSEIAEDVKAVVSRAKTEDWDVVGFTETWPKSGPVSTMLAAEARKVGWFLWQPGKGDEQILVNPKHRVLDTGYVHVLDGEGGRWPDHGVAYVGFQTPKGNEVYAHESHWITGFVLDRNDAVESRRERLHEEQTRAVVKQVVKHSLGGGLSFWMGDTNINEQRDSGFDKHAIHAIFTEAGLVSIFDALAGRSKDDDDYPGTHGSLSKSPTIDIIGHNRKDTRVKAQNVHVYPPNRNADHNLVKAVYRIEPPQEKFCRQTFTCDQPVSHPTGKHEAPVS